MTKKKSKLALEIELQNPVAKFAHRVNRAEFFRDRTVYSRKDKHKNNEPFLISNLPIVHQKKFVTVFNMLWSKPLPLTYLSQIHSFKSPYRSLVKKGD